MVVHMRAAAQGDLDRISETEVSCILSVHRVTYLCGSLLAGNQQKLLKYAKLCNILKLIQCLLLNNYLLTMNELEISPCSSEKII